MSGNYSYGVALPFAAMVAVECSNVVTNVLFKAATLKGLSIPVFNAYSSAFSLLVLLPLAFIFSRTTGLPPLKLSLLYRIFIIGLLGSVGQICAYKGIEYSSPTLASAIGNLTPAFTFALAVIFRMEKLSLRSSSIRAKIMGTVVSISGALVIVLYEGPSIISASSQPPSRSHRFALGSSEMNRVLGGLLLAIAYLLFSLSYIVQAQILQMYPSKMILVFLYNLSGTIIIVPLCLISETNLNAWRLKPDIALVAIIYAVKTLYYCEGQDFNNVLLDTFFCEQGFASSFITLIHTWCLHRKGPVYVSVFRPLSIAIAAAMGVIFLGDALYLGSLLGTMMIATGFYASIWGIEKGKEEIGEECGFGSLESPSSDHTPLLQKM